MDATLLVALLQPAPETYNLFDDVMLLSQGQIVFHGPREEVCSLPSPSYRLLFQQLLPACLSVCVSVGLSVCI